MDTELVTFHAVIVKARHCEDVFGALTGDRARQHQQAKTLYHKFASLVHEDRHVGDAAAITLAHEAMSLLSTFWRAARDKIQHGTYGTKGVPTSAAVIAGPKRKYTIAEAIGSGDLANVYAGADDLGAPVIVKMSRHATVNDLLANEARVSVDLALGASTSYGRFFPRLLAAFKVKDHLRVVRHVNVFADSRDGSIFTLNDLVANFPRGIDLRHFVWIFKRLLSMLGYAHGRGWVHGAVLPTHVLVRPADHSILLVDWSYACKAGERVLALSPGYRAYYAPEIINRAKATPATDLYMAAKCMEYVLGGEVALDVPTPFLSLVDACLLPNPNRRMADAFGAYDVLDRAAKAVYGPAKFVELVLT